MAFTEYYEARSVIKEIISKDLLGPVEEEEVISNDRPLDYYILGKLYPADTNAEITLGTSADDCGDLDEENSISLCNGKNPSSFGLSVALKKESSRHMQKVPNITSTTLNTQHSEKLHLIYGLHNSHHNIN